MSDLNHMGRTLARLSRVLEWCCQEISLPQYRILILVTSGDERATQLAGHLSLTKPTITAAVDGLVEKGLLRRAEVEGDRRAVRLLITPEGRKALQATEESIEKFLSPLLSVTKDRDRIVSAFSDLEEALNRILAERMSAKVQGATKEPAGAKGAD